ncbi:BRO-N domain-containing protein [Cupriavidus pinatubonensis]|uniref:BRO-N domain-containing protein n=1 Tax=Cupriavidus pinatubonensis TaxID=248026 RepID=UPI0011282EDE|nr:Bro-N domain-containing protein [Cupriavidus pinatubonensis]TPQ39878.1 hypothetical protein C2U69_11225 [Cupriavidus pinatubonensis]
MSIPTVFAFNSHAVRVITGKDGELWFVAADVCSALAITDVRQAVERLDEDERGGCSVLTAGGTQQVRAVNEPGLYSLILGSRKEEAKRFKRWVTHEVLPAIHKTGGYHAGPSTSQLAAHSLRLRLFARIEREQGPEMRSALYDQLRQLSDQMGLSTPSLESIRLAGSKDPDGLSRLWVVLDLLRGKGVAYNHAHDPKLLAINVPHLQKLCTEHRLVPPSTSQMSRALAAAPRFVDYRTVRSKLTGLSTKCWVFLADDSTISNQSTIQGA